MNESRICIQRGLFGRVCFSRQVIFPAFQLGLAAHYVSLTPMITTEWISFDVAPAYSGWFEIGHGPKSTRRVLPVPAFAWYDQARRKWQVNELDPTEFVSPSNTAGPFDLHWRGMRPEHFRSAWSREAEVASRLPS